MAYRDVQVALPFIDRLWWFLTPLMYPVAIVPEQLQPIYYLNPLAVVVSGFRWALAGGPLPPAYAFVLGSIVAVALLLSGWMFFRTREANFADVL